MKDCIQQGNRRFRRSGSLVALVLVAVGAVAEEPEPMLTRWAASVSPSNVHPEYPRPQFVRSEWQNLNGLWDYAITSDNLQPPDSYAGSILVPFPIESFLSGVRKSLDDQSTLWYRRRFTVPESWRSRRILLHFGAVDWATTVLVNGRKVGTHRGGYDSFTFDITPALKIDEQNELIVAVMDPTEGDQPRGKQSMKPEGIFYTPSSGIWQTVWLEPVPPERLTTVRFTPELDGGAVRIHPFANTLDPDVTVEIVVRLGDLEVGRVTAPTGAETRLRLSRVHPWSPADPRLYDVLLRLQRGEDTLDAVESYFGLRDIRTAVDADGVRKLFLNGKPLFQIGVLDQGFWPDGLYTAPTDEALRYDLETAKQMGFNLVRKHVKVESERWYYWADKLGVLVWQDMPSGNNATESGRRDFRRELQDIIDQKFNHPSIVMWVLFNEGWGQFDTERLVRWVKSSDPSRLVNNASGWTDAKAGDVIDVHSYPEPLMPSPDGVRAAVLGEFGGLGLRVDNHSWSSKSWAYQNTVDSRELTARCVGLLSTVSSLERGNGLAAAVYTQLTDIETECDGLMTYDREVLKVDAKKVYRANFRRGAIPAGTMVLPIASEGEHLWRYTTNAPPNDWTQLEFDSSDWQVGHSGFGSIGTPGTVVRTEWTTKDIWLRREFTLSDPVPSALILVIHHDESAEVYLNGMLAARLTDYTVGYEPIAIRPAALAGLRPGRNIIAIHCNQKSGGQFIDAGLLDVANPP